MMQYQIDPQDPSLQSIDKVMVRFINSQLEMTGLQEALAMADSALVYGKGELTGKVIDLYTQEPIQGATVRLLRTAFQCQTDIDGNFFFRQLPKGVPLTIDVESSGYANNQAVTQVSPSENSQGVMMKLKAVTSRVKVDLQGGVNARYNARTRELANGNLLQISTLDNAMTITISRENMSRIRSRLSRLARYANNSPAIVYVNITPIDPTREIEVFPGDFTTDDPRSAGEGRGKKLESVVLGEFSLVDENGQPLKGENGKPLNLSDLGLDVEVRLRLPDSLQQIYRQKYNQGERFIPWYAYNRNTGIWEISNNPAELILVEDVLYAVATATHFSWWNVDWPVETHGCIHGHVYKKGGVPAGGIQVKASGVDYQGENYAITDPGGHYNVTVKKDAWSKVTAQLGEYEASSNAVYVSEPKCQDCETEPSCCAEADVSFNLVDICGKVKDHAGRGLHGVYVYAGSGVGKFTDQNGSFRLVSNAKTTLKLKASYSSKGVDYYVNKDIEVSDYDLCGENEVSIILNLLPKYVRGKVTIIENGQNKVLYGNEVKIAAGNGFTTINKADGSYEVVVEQGTPQITISYRYYAVDGTYLEKYQTVSWDALAARSKVYGFTEVDDSSKDGIDVVFETNPVTLYGAVTNESGEPLSDILISTTLGKYTKSDVNGEYELLVPANAYFIAIARLSIPQGKINEEDKKEISTSISDMAVNFVLDNRIAKIYGQVKEAEGGPLLPGVLVMSECGDSAVSGPDGSFILTVPADQEVDVFFTCGDHYPETRSFMTPARGQTIRVSDTDSDYIALPKINYQPVIDKLEVKPGFKVCPEDEVTLDIMAFDPDPNDTTHLNYFVNVASVTNPGEAVIQPEQDSNVPHHFVWTAPANMGWYSLTITVSDGHPDNSSTSVRVRLEVADCTEVVPNKYPVILYMNPQKPMVCFPGETKALSVVAYDPDQDPLCYKWQVFQKANSAMRFLAYNQDDDVSADWQFSDPNGKSTSLTVPNVFTLYGLDANQPVDYAITVTVKDDREGRVEKEMGLRVLANCAPVIKLMTAEPGQCIVGDAVKLRARAADFDGIASYTWYYQGQEIGSTTDPNSCITWTPQGSGDLDIKLVVWDKNPAKPMSQTQYLLVQVKEESVPTVSGYVRDAYGSPVAGVLVEIYDADNRQDLDEQTVTDAQGYYEFMDLPSGTYYVVVARDGYLQVTQIVKIN